MVVQLFAESIGQPREAPHPHPHVQVLPFNVARVDVLRIGPSANRGLIASRTNGRAVSDRCFGRRGVTLNEHRIVDVAIERRIYCAEIDVVSIGRELNTIREPTRQVLHERDCGLRAARADLPARDQLGVSGNRGPGPDIAITQFALELGGDVLRLRVNEAPNFIALDALAWKIP